MRQPTIAMEPMLGTGSGGLSLDDGCSVTLY